MSADDPYVYPGTSVLVNNFDYKDQGQLEFAETNWVLHRTDEIRNEPIEGNFDLDHLKAIHKHLFQDVYPTQEQSDHPFSGEVRTIGIRKDAGIDYPHPDDPSLNSLSSRLEYAFDQLSRDNLTEPGDLTAEQFSNKLAKHSAEIWECHPFRDGNTRTTLFFTEQLSKEAGFEFTKNFELEAQFREAISDYARGEKNEFLDLLSELIAPTQSLEVVNLQEGIDKISFEQYTNAKHMLDQEQQSIAESMRKEWGIKISDLERQASELHVKFENLVENRPIASSYIVEETSETYKEWKNEALVTAANRNSILDHIESALEGKLAKENAMFIESDSKRQAFDALPILASVIENHDTDKRIGTLISKLNEVNEKLVHSQDSNDVSVNKNLLNIKAGILSEFKNSSMIQSRLSPSANSLVNKQHQATKADLLKLNTKSLDRGR